MKIVLSRKGFDSKAGGGPSPILPDGTMLSLPIPEPSEHEGAGVPYSSLRVRGGLSYLDLMLQLGYRRPDEIRGAHVDPDLVAQATQRAEGWRPIFGQSHAAQTHLANAGVDVGDLFLFFGLFRRTVRRGEKVAWAAGSPRVQALFGYLEVGEKIPVGRSITSELPWAADHPHLRDVDRTNNTIYIAADRLSVDGAFPGAGTFRWSSKVCLSAATETASVWRLPACFGPPEAKPLTYHLDANRWQRNGDGTWRVQSVARGQEFVIEADDDLRTWALDLIRSCSGNGAPI